MPLQCAVLIAHAPPSGACPSLPLPSTLIGSEQRRNSRRSLRTLCTIAPWSIDEKSLHSCRTSHRVCPALALNACHQSTRPCDDINQTKVYFNFNHEFNLMLTDSQERPITGWLK